MKRENKIKFTVNDLDNIGHIYDLYTILYLVYPKYYELYI